MSKKLLVQDFLESHSFAELFDQHGVKARVSRRDSSVFTLNYDQLAVKDSDLLSHDCRGLVLRAESGIASATGVVGPTSILARPMSRFFNLGQETAAAVDFNHKDTKYYSKLDGTLILLFHDPIPGTWHVATRGVPDADVISDSGVTFRYMFEQTLMACAARTFDEFTSGLPNHLTWIFELTAPENQIVVYYDKREITLLAVRDRHTGKEFHPEEMQPMVHPVKACPSFSLNSISEMIDFVRDMDPKKHEGLVVRDHNFRRVKVKSPGYLAMSRTKDSVLKSPRAMLSLILMGKEDDAKALLPDYVVERIDNMKAAILNLVKATDAEYKELHQADRKAMAMGIVAKKAWMDCHMHVYSNKATDTWDYIQKARHKNGEWQDNFLDLLFRLSKYSPIEASHEV